MLHVPSVCTPCCRFFRVVGSCWELLRKVWNRSNFWATNSLHFFCYVIAEARRNNLGSVCTALLTLLGPRTCQDAEFKFTKSNGLYHSHDVLQVHRKVVASVCTCCPSSEETEEGQLSPPVAKFAGFENLPKQWRPLRVLWTFQRSF